MGKAEDMKAYRKMETKGTPVQVLVTEARILQRLIGQRRRAMKIVKEIDRKIKVTRRNIKGQAHTLEQMPPLRMFGEK